MITKERAEVALEKLANKYSQELEEEDLEPSTVEEDSNFPGNETDGEGPSPLRVLNLAAIPIGEWNSLRVSRVSTFGDVQWDWRKEGSPLYRDSTNHFWNMKLGAGVSLLAEEFAPLLNLLRALLFYWMPQNALFVGIKSFNSTADAGTGLIPLGRFLAEHGLYLDRQGNGKFRTANEILPEDFNDFYEKLTKMGERTFFIRHVKYWWQLSQAGVLPPEYQLGYMPFDASTITKAYKEFDEAKTPYLPIKLETLSVLMSHCFEIVEKYSEDILFAYGLFWPVMAGKSKSGIAKFDWHHALEQFEQRQTTLWRMEQFADPTMQMPWRVAMELRQAIMIHPDWESSSYYRSRTSLYQTPLEDVKKIAAALGMDVRELNKAVQYDVNRVWLEVMTMATALRNACAVIIFLVTGMRRSELANLRTGSYWEVPGQPGSYRLRYLVFKTSEGSQGNEHEIPIPHIAYQALCLLERLTTHARKFGRTDLLFTNTARRFGKPIGLSTINAFLTDWCEALGLSEVIHPHQFRKTLAIFLIYQDTGNLPLIKRLFSHKSLRMSLAYIIKLPGIAQEVKLILLEQNMSLMSELLQAASSGVIGGVAGLRIKENAKAGKYAAMLNDDGWESIEQYVDSLLDEGIVLLHRASLGVICTRTLTVDQPAPCDAPFAQKIKRIHPNIQNCDPFDCKFAVFTESSIEKLLNEIIAHKYFLAHPYAKDDQKQFSQREVSKSASKLLELGFDESGSPVSVGFGEGIA